MVGKFGIILPGRRDQANITAFPLILVPGKIVTAGHFLFTDGSFLLTATAIGRPVRPSSAGFLRRTFSPGKIHPALFPAAAAIICPVTGIVPPSSAAAKQQYQNQAVHSYLHMICLWYHMQTENRRCKVIFYS